ncbi:FAD-dependent oxidoreductase [Tellurirhabdus rosea]|uniref:FAD-dependent oxidoreductase n=1 Tax=Tellurirhabdus rosea TaxID=2674997 RepID=UPI0022535D6A|nr:FAD-dependent oxidoreductase [Tellurirhabdus rosea]
MAFPPIPRRFFLKQAALAAGVLLAGPAGLSSCQPATAHIRGGLKGPSHAAGHLLRNIARLPVPDGFSDTHVLIIGGGIAGLSARRWLHRQGVRDVLLVELEEAVGGNSRGDETPTAAHPWGAHYLPVLDLRNRELLQFLEECGSLTGFDPDQKPIYNEYHLCHDPEERLFINGFWQEGLVPETGLSEDEKAQILRFDRLMEGYRQARGADGKDAFAIPLVHSSADARFRELDRLSFADFLDSHGFTSPHLRWYLDYCCRDDYGATTGQTSAWAGIHYFAARKGQAANADASAVLTWPEGNQFLVSQLRQQADSAIRSKLMAFDVRLDGKKVLVSAYDTETQKTAGIRADFVIMATPQFVNRPLLRNLPAYTPPDLHYAPWLIANLTIDGLPQDRGAPLCWDNVLYGTRSVGYITASHQHLHQTQRKVITYYRPLTEEAPDEARRRAYQTTYGDWLQAVLAELETAHPGITPRISEADIWIWGHGMVAPTPGFLQRPPVLPVADRLFFAHSDLSGISIFEEAFYQGIRAAQAILDRTS